MIDLRDSALCAHHFDIFWLTCLHVSCFGFITFCLRYIITNISAIHSFGNYSLGNKEWFCPGISKTKNENRSSNAPSLYTKLHVPHKLHVSMLPCLNLCCWCAMSSILIIWKEGVFKSHTHSCWFLGTCAVVNNCIMCTCILPAE